MKKLIALLLAVLMLLSMVACGGDPGIENPGVENPGNDTPDTTQGDSSGPQKGGVLKYTFHEMSPTWDPYGQAAWTTYIWAQNVVENCLVRGEDDKVYPLVCEYEYAEDGLSLKLWIREGVKFSDGTPVTLEDVVASLQRAALFSIDVQTNLWDNVENYTIENDVLTFLFKEYNLATFDVFCDTRPCNGGIMPKAICEKYGENYITDANDCIGTGPYKLIAAKSEAGAKATFERNEHYAVCEASPDGNGYASPRRQYLDGMVFIKNADNNSRLMSLMRDELHVLDTSTRDAYENMLQSKGYTEALFPAGGALYTFFNCSAGRPTADVNLRKAIAAVLDFNEIAHAHSGELYDADICSPLNCSTNYKNDVFTSQDWYSDRQANVELAKQYLEKSNYKGEKLTIVTNSGGSVPIIVEDLQAIGINCDAESLDNATCIAYANDDSLDWDIIYRSNPYATSNPGTIHSTFYKTWHNDRAMELVKLLRTVPDESAESIAYWEELATLMAEDVPFVIFSGTKDYYICAPGLNLNRQGAWRYFFNAYWDNPAEHMNY